MLLSAAGVTHKADGYNSHLPDACTYRHCGLWYGLLLLQLALAGLSQQAKVGLKPLHVNVSAAVCFSEVME